MRGFLFALIVVLAACGSGTVNVCPSGQPCLHLVADPGVGGNGTSDDGGTADLSQPASSADLASLPAKDQGAAPADLTSSSSDLAAACVATGGSCAVHNDSVCCSKYCVYATNTCK
jgi:hypothetical protein